MSQIRRVVLIAILAACNSHDNNAAGLFLNRQVQINQGPGFGEGQDIWICCDGDTVYAVWEDDRNDRGGNEDVFFNRSLDGGDTWLASDIRVNSNGAGTSDSDNPKICCFGQRIYVVWHDTALGSEYVFFNYSTDGGLTWQGTDERLDAAFGDSDDASPPQICCDGLNVYVIWEKDRERVYVNASSDGGVTWMADEVRVDTDLGLRTEGPVICCSGTTAYAAWRTENPGSVIHATVSTDGGATWAAEATLSTGAVDPPLICCDGPYVHVAWDDNDETDIFVNSSMNSGTSWLGAKRVNTNAEDDSLSESPSICCDGLNVYIAWNDDRRGPENVYFNRSTDGGASWGANDLRLDTGAVSGRNCNLCCEGNTVYAAWTDKRRDPNDDVYFTYSTDGGLTFAPNVRVDTDNIGDDPNRPKLCCDNGTVYVYWHLDVPTSDLYLNRARP